MNEKLNIKDNALSIFKHLGKHNFGDIVYSISLKEVALIYTTVYLC